MKRSLMVLCKCLQYSAREADEVGYCHFCCRQLYFTDALFCDRACENRKRQLSWKSANIDTGTCNRRPAITVITENHPISWQFRYKELPKAKKNRYVWSSQPPAYRDRLQQPHKNFTRYIPSWDMYEAKA